MGAHLNAMYLFFFFSNHTGGVLVKATLAFSSHQISAGLIKRLLMKATAKGNEISGLKINPEFTPGKHE